MTDLTTISSLGLMLAWGMRHGLDPDHLAAVDGLTLRTATVRPRWSPWLGGLFALGHGFVVLGFAYAASLAPDRVKPSGQYFDLLEWLPIALLFLLGVVNARALLTKSTYHPQGLRGRFVPRILRESSGPWAAILVGMVFALVFDTALQATAWGYAASAIGGTTAALISALTFTLGMILTDLLDGWVTWRVLRTANPDTMSTFRRRLGWPVVVLCFGIAGYGAMSKIDPSAQIAADIYSWLGGAMLAVVAAVYGFTLYYVRQKPLN